MTTTDAGPALDLGAIDWVIARDTAAARRRGVDLSLARSSLAVAQVAALVARVRELEGDAARLDFLRLQIRERGQVDLLTEGDGSVRSRLWERRYVTSYEFVGADLRRSLDAARAALAGEAPR